jgi:hypothetical protein
MFNFHNAERTQMVLLQYIEDLSSREESSPSTERLSARSISALFQLPLNFIEMSESALIDR